MKYSPSKIEHKWQKYWESKKIYETKDSENDKRNFMLLVEFPYPSGDLHTGHWYAFAVPDIYGRYLRMKGFNVMYPIGFDAFGLPAENAAIQRKIHPRDWTKANIKKMSKQLRSMGAAFDWSREVQTINPEYYKWTQWMFLKFYEKGLAYRAQTFVNWCSKDKTVLANEQVINGCCDRCGTEVEQKELAQWMFKITDYADRLVDDLDKIDYPETVKVAQRNWIGRSEGAIIQFLIPNSKFLIPVFTTRADTLFGSTYLVLAPEHPMVMRLTKDENLNAVNKYLEEVRKKTELERLHIDKSKTGVATGGYAVNPVNNEKIPVWVADYVIGWYGTGAVMAVPAHDERDHEFARKYNLPIKQVIEGLPSQDGDYRKRAFEDDGKLINSGRFDGLSSAEARKKIVEELKEKGLAEFKKNYKLHDWALSRQRYWGVPIPMIHCKECARHGGQGYLPVPEKDLPVELPNLEDFKPTDSGRSPLAKVAEWVKVKCPKCNSEAERETDTMDTFVDSSWYFLRYADPKNKKEFADKKKMGKWLPVPLYIGGAEHNTMHLLYSRFFTKALYDSGYLNFNEPFLARRNHGIILGPDNQKMSKSRGNVVDPDIEVKKFGADTIRMYLAFMGPYDQGGPWNPEGIQGIYRFLNRVWNFINEPMESKITDKEVNPERGRKGSQRASASYGADKIINKAIKEIGDDIKDLKFNTGVSGLMKLLNALEDKQLTAKQYETFLKLLAPFAPHITEELWQQLRRSKPRRSKRSGSRPQASGKSIHLESWPKYDEVLLAEEMIDLVLQVNGKLRDTIKVKKGLSEEEIRGIAMSNENVKRHLVGKEVKKFIYVKDRVANIVIG